MSTHGIGDISPPTIQAGVAATARVIMTNSSVYAGTPTLAPYTFTVAIKVTVGAVTVLDTSRQVTMSPGSFSNTSFLFTIPAGSTGLSGQATAWLLTTGGERVLVTTPTVNFVVGTGVPAIYVGLPAIDRGGYFTSGYTVISMANPADASGPLNQVQMWVHTTMSEVKVATFQKVSTGFLTASFTARAAVTLGGTISPGLRAFSVNLPVQAGDYIGIYFPQGWLGSSMPGVTGDWFVTGDKTACVNTTFVVDAVPEDLSLCGIGY